MQCIRDLTSQVDTEITFDERLRVVILQLQADLGPEWEALCTTWRCPAFRAV